MGNTTVYFGNLFAIHFVCISRIVLPAIVPILEGLVYDSNVIL
jgi:hypothetical protein